MQKESRNRLRLLMPLLALLAVIVLAGLMAPSSALLSDPPESCPVTRPPDPPFVPPAPYPAAPGEGSFWYGSEKLWTNPRKDGTWRSLPHYVPTWSSYRQKLFWWRKGYFWHANPMPNLKVTGRRLDAPAPPFVSPRASNGHREQDWKSFMVVGVDIPTLGCWEITGRYEGKDSLTFVVWVGP